MTNEQWDVVAADFEHMAQCSNTPAPMQALCADIGAFVRSHRPMNEDAFEVVYLLWVVGAVSYGMMSL